MPVPSAVSNEERANAFPEIPRALSSVAAGILVVSKDTFGQRCEPQLLFVTKMLLNSPVPVKSVVLGTEREGTPPTIVTEFKAMSKVRSPKPVPTARKAVPLHCLRIVLRDASALAIRASEHELGSGFALLGSKTPPLYRLNIVLRDALALKVHCAEMAPGSGVALLSQRSP